MNLGVGSARYPIKWYLSGTFVTAKCKALAFFLIGCKVFDWVCAAQRGILKGRAERERAKYSHFSLSMWSLNWDIWTQPILYIGKMNSQMPRETTWEFQFLFSAHQSSLVPAHFSSSLNFVGFFEVRYVDGSQLEGWPQLNFTPKKTHTLPTLNFFEI